MHRPALWRATGGEHAAGAVSGVGAKAAASLMERARATIAILIVILRSIPL